MYHRPGIDSPRAHHTAFAAQHTIFQRLLRRLVFSSPHKMLYLSQAERSKLPRRTSRRTAPATDTQQHRPLPRDDPVPQRRIHPVQINRPRRIDCKTEIHIAKLAVHLFVRSAMRSIARPAGAPAACPARGRFRTVYGVFWGITKAILQKQPHREATQARGQ